MPTKKTILIDDVSGEVVYENTEYRSWQDALTSDKGIHVWHRNGYVKIWPQLSIDESMTVAEYGSLCKAMRYMEPDNSLPTLVKLAAQIRMSESNLRKYVSVWKAKGAIRKDDRRVSYVNPMYGLYGKWLSPKLYRLFQEELNAALPKWTIDRFASM